MSEADKIKDIMRQLTSDGSLQLKVSQEIDFIMEGNYAVRKVPYIVVSIELDGERILSDKISQEYKITL